LIETVTLLGERGIELRSLKENIDTTTPNGKLMFHIIGAMAEFGVMTFFRTIFPANAWKAESRAIITGLVAPLDEEKWSDRCSPEPTTKHPDHRIPFEVRT